MDQMGVSSDLNNRHTHPHITWPVEPHVTPVLNFPPTYLNSQLDLKKVSNTQQYHTLTIKQKLITETIKQGCTSSLLAPLLLAKTKRNCHCCFSQITKEEAD
ncbi:hypothetical protein KIL84_013458 [Mauremys mutica]|uniref:Uncharacterized protein n=1 Tax=Mauremys mutica TaxID=74926 RepID=A0A9D4AS48_9SAUR|nr:hypothetical protein KIL84_013458 [Mauremys mutica]